MSAPFAEEDILKAATEAWRNDVLRGLQAPDPSLFGPADSKALFGLHLGAAYHRLAVIVDVLRFYARSAHMSAVDYPSLGMLAELCDRQEPYDRAMFWYEQSAGIEPDLAEAHFNLARVKQLQGHLRQALAGFDTTLALRPHPMASPHAFLHANAYWERATLLEALGHNREALKSYRAAIARITNFGVHHVQAARLLRRMGYVEEAISHYRRCMAYSHRYFAEFILPPLSPPAALPASPLEAIYETSKGEVVVFWQGRYYAVPHRLWLDTAGKLVRLSPKQSSACRRSSSIVAFESLEEV